MVDAEWLLKSHRELAYLDKIQPQGKVEPGTAEKRDETIKPPNKTVGL